MLPSKQSESGAGWSILPQFVEVHACGRRAVSGRMLGRTRAELTVIQASSLESLPCVTAATAFCALATLIFDDVFLRASEDC